MKKFKKYYALVFILIMIIVVSISASYAIFSNTKEEHGKLNIVAGTLDYKIENKNLKNDQITVNSNDKITTTLKITSLNTISSKYELYYQIENNIKDVKIGYASNTKDNVKGSELMIKKIAWDTFKNTGDVNTFLELKQFQGIEEQLQNNNMEQKAEKYGDNKNKWDNNL